MTKKELTDKISVETEQNRKIVEKILNSFFQNVKDTLANGDKLAIAGFGTFEVRQAAARTAKVPGTDRTVEVPAKKAVKFKAAKELKEVVEEG